MPPVNILIAETLDDACAQWLADRLPAGSRVQWAKAEDGASLDGFLPTADALIVRTYTQVNAALLAKAPRLQVVARAGVGLDNIDLAACKARGIPVVYTPDANTQAVVEYAWGLFLDHARPRTPLPQKADAAVFHRLRKTEVGRELAGMTLGIVGMGRIGKRMAEVAHAFGLNILACDVLPEVEIRKALRQIPFDFVRHADLYAGSDLITVHADGRKENQNLLNADAFRHFRKGAVLLNAARGMLVDAEACAAWLKADPSAHAYLDVHEPEPPPADYPLWGVPNATLLPHLASRTGPALRNMSWVVRDVVSVLEGRAPRYPANAPAE